MCPTSMNGKAIPFFCKSLAFGFAIGQRPPPGTRCKFECKGRCNVQSDPSNLDVWIHFDAEDQSFKLNQTWPHALMISGQV